MHRTALKIVGFRRAEQRDPILAATNLGADNHDIEGSTR
jgi:hypothetical protein